MTIATDLPEPGLSGITSGPSGSKRHDRRRAASRTFQASAPPMLARSGRIGRREWTLRTTAFGVLRPSIQTSEVALSRREPCRRIKRTRLRHCNRWWMPDVRAPRMWRIDAEGSTRQWNPVALARKHQSTSSQYMKNAGESPPIRRIASTETSNAGPSSHATSYGLSTNRGAFR